MSVEFIWRTYGVRETEVLNYLATRDFAFKETESVSELVAIIDLGAIRQNHVLSLKVASLDKIGVPDFVADIISVMRYEVRYIEYREQEA